LRSRPSRKVVVRIDSAAGDKKRSAEAVQRTKGDQRALRPRKSVEQRTDREQEQAGDVITAYSIFFGGVLLLGGRLADLLGRRRLSRFAEPHEQAVMLGDSLARDTSTEHSPRAFRRSGSTDSDTRIQRTGRRWSREARRHLHQECPWRHPVSLGDRRGN
jgi:hypothetical protein